MDFPAFLPDFLGASSGGVAPPVIIRIITDERSDYAGDYLGEASFGGDFYRLVEILPIGPSVNQRRGTFAGTYLGLSPLGGGPVVVLPPIAFGVSFPPTRSSITAVGSRSSIENLNSQSSIKQEQTISSIKEYKTRASYYA